MHFDALKDRCVSFFGSTADTGLVLFFLALEFGRTTQRISVDGTLMLITMAMVAVLPYFLPSNADRPEFNKWLAGRSLTAFFATLLGMVLSRSFGTVLPESMRFLPLTLLIFASFASCFIQFYGLMRLRLAK